MTATQGLDFLNGWRDGTRAARSELDRRLRSALPAHGYTLDVEGRVVPDPGIPSGALAAPRPPRRDLASTPSGYRLGRTRGWDATWQDGLERLREELAPIGLHLTEEGELTGRATPPARARELAPLAPLGLDASTASELPAPGPILASRSLVAPHPVASGSPVGEAPPCAPSGGVLSRIWDVLVMVLRRPNRRAALVTLASGLVAAGGLIFSPPSSSSADLGKLTPTAQPSSIAWQAPTLWDLESHEVRSGLLALDRRFHEVEVESGGEALKAEVAFQLAADQATTAEAQRVEQQLVVRWVRDRQRADLLIALLPVFKPTSDVRVRRAVIYTVFALGRQLGQSRIEPQVREVLEDWYRTGSEGDPQSEALLEVTLDALS